MGHMCYINCIIEQTVNQQSKNGETTTNQQGLLCSWRSGTEITMPSVLVKQLLTD